MLRVRRGKLPLLAAAVGATLPSLGFAQNGLWTYQGDGAHLSWTATWSVNSNWTPNTSFPNGAAQVATFGPAGVSQGDGTVMLDATKPITLAQLNFIDAGALNSVTNGPRNFSLAGAGSLTIANATGTISVTAADSLQPAVSTIYSRLITPAGTTLYKMGAGTLVLSGTNAFNGNGISVNEGVLIATSGNAIGGAQIISTAGSGVFALQNASTSGSMTFGGLGASTAPGGAIQSLQGDNTWTGMWFIVTPGSTGVAAGSTLTLNGSVVDSQGTETNGLSKYGAGTFKVASLGLYGPLLSDAGAFTSAGDVLVASLTVNSGTFTAVNVGPLTGAAGPLLISRADSIGFGTASFTASGAVSAGAVTINAGTYSSGALTATGPVAIGNSVTFTAGRITAAGAVTVGQGAKVKISQNGAAANVSVLSGGLSLPGTAAAPTAQVDIVDNDLILKGGVNVQNDIRQQIRAAYAAGAWTGANGITSSKAKTAPNAGELKKTAIGYGAANSFVPTKTIFDGVAVAATDILIKYTYVADANLDGSVDGLDIGIWGQNFTGALGAAGTKPWSQGDWNYDGSVDGLDAGLWGQNFTGALGAGGLSLPFDVNPEAISILQGMGIDVTLVPEPTSIGLGAIGAMGLLGARRRRRREQVV